MAVTKYIVFRLNDQKYSMKLTKINGIEYVYHVVPVPMGPACIKGIIHLRNEVIPVFSLKRLFGMPEEAAEMQLLIAAHRLWKQPAGYCSGKCTTAPSKDRKDLKS